MADVPLGMFLSGGIDSAAITAMMSQLVDEPIKTFSVGFAEREANELAYARIVAKRVSRPTTTRCVVSPERVLRRAADARLARGRADRASVERRAATSSRGSPRST